MTGFPSLPSSRLTWPPSFSTAWTARSSASSARAAGATRHTPPHQRFMGNLPPAEGRPDAPTPPSLRPAAGRDRLVFPPLPRRQRIQADDRVHGPEDPAMQESILQSIGWTPLVKLRR